MGPAMKLLPYLPIIISYLLILYSNFSDHWFGGNQVLKLNTQKRKLGNRNILIFRLVFGLQLAGSASRRWVRRPRDKISTCLAFQLGLGFSTRALMFRLALDI